MKKVQLTMGEYGYEGSYESLIESANLAIFVNQREDAYQGDSLLLVRDNDTGLYGTISFGWGSCSGCDALEGASTLKEIDELRDSLVDGVVWEKTLAPKARLKAKDWSLEWNEELGRAFTKQVLNYK